jgi:molybdate transport system substrate-binding protein
MRALFVIVMCAVLSQAASAENIRVAAAISLKEAAVEIARDYENDTGEHVEFAFGASGQLSAQIRSGAPVDLFISAADVQMDQLDKAGLIDNATRQDVAGNRLVLVVPADESHPPACFKDLAAENVKRVAIGEPKTVPAGHYAQQVLKKLNLDRVLKDKVVFGANVRQVLDYVERGEVDAGIVYATDAKEAGDKVKVVAIADESAHDPIRYPAAVVTTGERPSAARRFLAYLKTEPARKVFKSRGFSVGGAATRPAAP